MLRKALFGSTLLVGFMLWGPTAEAAQGSRHRQPRGIAGYAVLGPNSIGAGLGVARGRGAFSLDVALDPDPETSYDSEAAILFGGGYRQSLRSTVGVALMGYAGVSYSEECTNRVPGSCEAWSPSSNPEQQYSDGLLSWREDEWAVVGAGLLLDIGIGGGRGFTLGARLLSRVGFSASVGILW